MFGLVRDIAKEVGGLVGGLIGIPMAVIAETLGISVSMVNEAINSGCKTYNDIRKYHSL